MVYNVYRRSAVLECGGVTIVAKHGKRASMDHC
jgi:hypothetical protein